MIDWAERRIKSRHKAPDLKLTIRTTGLKRWLVPSVSANCIDINRYGMAITADKKLRAGDCVVVGFKGKYILQSNVPAIVTECIQVDNSFRASLRFAYAMDSRKYCRKMDNALSRIESIYNTEDISEEDPESNPSKTAPTNKKALFKSDKRFNNRSRLNTQKQAC